MSLEKEIFNGKTLADLFSEIHSNSTTTRTQVIQRIEANSMKGESVDAMFSPEELAQLLETTEDIIEEVENVKEEKEE